MPSLHEAARNFQGQPKKNTLAEEDFLSSWRSEAKRTLEGFDVCSRTFASAYPPARGVYSFGRVDTGNSFEVPTLVAFLSRAGFAKLKFREVVVKRKRATWLRRCPWREERKLLEHPFVGKAVVAVPGNNEVIKHR